MIVPDGMEVERLAIAMASAVGLAWPKATAETAMQFRVVANAALFHLGAQGVPQGQRRLADALSEAAEAVRVGAKVLDHHKLSEELIQRLHRAASTIETVGFTLGVMAPEASEEVI